MKSFLKVFLIASLVQLAVSSIAYASPSSEELKAWLSTPAALLVLMYAGSFSSALTNLKLSSDSGSPMSLSTYLGHWPETLAVILGNGIAFVVLVLTDQLNFASALGIGYGANNVADLLRKGGRTPPN